MARFRSRSATTPLAPGDEAEPAVAGPGADAALVGYRLIRRLAAGERADVHLAAVEGDPDVASPDSAESAGRLVVMRVYGPGADDASITTEIEAMEHDGSGATPALLDLATLPDGRACLVVERITGPSLRGLLAAGDLLAGQAVTALAPIVVAVRELGDRGLVHTRLSAGDILLDEAGRPRLIGLGALARLDESTVPGERAALLRHGHLALLRLVEEVVSATRDARVFDPALRTIRTAVETRPFARTETELERALFAAAEPLPLPRAPSDPPTRGLPSRLGPIGRTPVADAVAPDEGAARPDGARRRHAALGRLAELAQLPGGLVGELAASLDHDPRAALARGVADWARRRRGVLLVGGLVGAGALVAVLTAVPPSAADAPSAATATPAPVAVADAPADDPLDASGGDAAQPGPESDGGGTAVSDDPVAAAAALLEIRTSCLASGDAACLAAVDQPGSPIDARDRAAIAAGTPGEGRAADLDAITLVADLGDAVVLAVPDLAGEREPASLLMMRSEAGWRLREWFD